MSKGKNQSKEKVVAREVHESYQPTKGNLDSSNPPKGGSGVPSKTKSNSKTKK